jgi:5-methylcytosine-specific restriction endonuclease McrA
MPDDTCICCGAYVPEGRQVCPNCERGASKMYEPPKRRKLSKSERKTVYNKFAGHCAYCGEVITMREMQVDHFVALRRGGTDTIDNMLPACRSCNYYKDTLTIEDLRDSIQKWPAVLERDSVTYRNAVRFGMVIPNPHSVIFYFEMEATPCKE